MLAQMFYYQGMEKKNKNMMIMTEKGLSDKQEMAVDLILAGMNDREIAKRMGVSRKTINTWRNHDEDFRTLLAERRMALHERHHDELSGLVSEAIGVMREAMREGDIVTRLRAAQAVMRTSGLQAAMKAEKPASREEIIREFLSKAIGEVAVELGANGARRLPDGE